MRAGMLIAAAALVCGVTPATADAARLVNFEGTLTYQAAPGEQNRIEFQPSQFPGTLHVGPVTGALVQGCEPTGSETTAVCRGVGGIIADLGDGDDIAWAMEPYAATLLGGAGDDSLVLIEPGVGSVLSGGPGLDTALMATESARPINVSLDDVANDGFNSVQVTSDVENVTVMSTAPASLIGNAGANDLVSGEGNDTLVGGGGSDTLFSHRGDDTLDARDGETDRVECGPGTDKALVDQLDQVGDSCEVVQVSQISLATPDDAPPTVAFQAGDELVVTAADDRGVAGVRFLSGDRTLCTDTTAPYSCDFQPRVEDVGRMTVVAVAADALGQTATAARVIEVDKLEPRSVSLSLKRSGKRVIATGKVVLPAGVPCSGEIAVTTGKKTRTGKLTRSCMYRIVLSSGGSYYAAYRGTKAIEAKRSAWRTAR